MFNFISHSFKIKMNKNSVTYLQGINFVQLTLTEKTEIKNSGHATHEVVLLFRVTRPSFCFGHVKCGND
jgi:hypothetical protein